MSKRRDSVTCLLPSTSVSRFGKEKGNEPLVISSPMQLPRRRTSTVRVASDGDSTGYQRHSPTSHPSTPTSASAKLLRMTSKVGLKSLDTASNSSLRSIAKATPKPAGSPVQPKNTFRLKAPKPLKLDEKMTTPSFEQQQPQTCREIATPSYEEQFRRRRGDLLHRLGPSVPYMQAYDSTSLQYDALTTRLLEYVCEPGTPSFYKFNSRGAVTTVLDLGCGPQLRWIMTAAPFWPNAKITGVDCVRPNPDIQIPSNVEFVQGNFLNGLPTIRTESIDFVRMSCLGTSIPEGEWPIILNEVRRVLKTGGVVEVIDDELVRAYPEYSPGGHEILELKGPSSPVSTGGWSQKAGLHPIEQSFAQMLVERYGMPAKPHRTIDASMELVFGANDKKHFRVELPSPNFKIFEIEEAKRNGNLFQAFRTKRDVPQYVPPDTAAKAQRVLGITPVAEKISDPFLIFYPHGLCRLDASEVRMAACGTMHRVLSCRASLIDSIVGPGAEGKELDKVTDMLWAYERFYQSKLDLPNDSWNDLSAEGKESGKETPISYRSSSDSYDSGYSSFQSSSSNRVAKGKKPSTSITSDSNDCTLVRCFRVFHATKV